jgi:hypothetical protein
VYTTPGLVSGSYRLYFDPYYGASVDYVAEYYDDQPALGSGTSIAVTAPGVVAGLDAALARGGKITGTVTAADGGRPLAGVYVYIYTDTTVSRFDYVAYASTNDAGAYALTGLASGTYYLLFDPDSGEAESYQQEYYNDQASLATATGVNVAAPATTGGVNASVVRGGSITGRVTVEGTGASYEGASVYAYVSTSDLRESTSSDADGHYTLAGLSTGAYRVRFYDSFIFTTGCVQISRSISEYYNGQASYDAADPVAVTAPAATGNIDAALPLAGPPEPGDRLVFLPLVQR